MTCCGQQMKTEGSKLVCGKCGGWFEGFALVLAGGGR